MNPADSNRIDSAAVSDRSRNRLAMWRIGAVGSAGAALALGAAAGSGLMNEASGAAVLAAIAAGGISLSLIAFLLWPSKQEEEAARELDSRNGRAGRSSGGSRRPHPHSHSPSHGDEAAMLKDRIGDCLEALFSDTAALKRILLHHGPLAESNAAAMRERATIKQIIQDRLEQLHEWEKLQDQHEELALRQSHAAKLLQESRDALARASQNLQQGKDQWQRWLAAHHLPTAMSPVAALESFTLAEQALEKLRQYDRLLDKQEGIKREIAAYSARTAELCEGCEESLSHLPKEPALALRLLQTEIKRHQAAKQEAEKLGSELRELKLLMDEGSLREKEVQLAIDEMIAAAGLDDESRFESALEDRRRLKELIQEWTRLDIELSAGSSLEQKNELIELLGSQDEEQLLEELNHVQETVLRLEHEKQELLEKRGGIRQELEQLSQEDERQRLLLEREMVLAELDEAMERYAVLTISKSLIERTKRIYEEERQPVVLRNASSYISRLTEGKYVRVVAKQEKSELALLNHGHSYVESAFLSRGTAEQLYLAMRLSLASEAAVQVKLPLLLDDLFVNFDHKRLGAAVQLVKELAKERQILLFTCHEHIRDALLHANEDARLITMEAVSGAAVADSLANHKNEPA